MYPVLNDSCDLCVSFSRYLVDNVQSTKDEKNMNQEPLRVAIVIHASLDNRESTMRVYNALQAALEFKEAGDVIDVFFDGAGTRTAVQIAEPDHMLYDSFKAIEENISSVCRFCAGSMDVVEAAQKAGIQLSAPHQHLSFRNLVRSGYQVLNF